MVKLSSIWLILIIATTLLLSACGGLAGEPKIVATVRPQPTTIPVQISAPVQTPSVALGSSIFAENCTPCHGQNAQGDGELVASGQVTAPPDFTQPAWNDGASPMDRFATITNGRMEKLMPPWSGSLSDYERWSVAMYVYSLSYTMDELTSGEAIFAARCAECHGEDGTGGDNAPSLTGLWDVSDGVLSEKMMQGDVHPFEDTLTPEDRVALVAYVRSLSVTAEIAPQVADGETDGTFVHPDVSSAGSDETNSIGTIQGQVIQGTEGGTLPDEMPVRLHVIDEQMNETFLDTTTDAEGYFKFEDMLFNPNLVFITSVDYNGETYISDFQRGSGDVTTLDMPITVYDLTHDSSVLSIGSLVSQVFTFADQIQVVEIYEVYNDSDRIYMRSEPGDSTEATSDGLTFTLPEGASYLNISDNNRYTVSEDGRQVTDTLPVLPGEPHLTHLVYSLPKPGDRVEVTQVLDYPLDGRMEVHVETGAATVEGDSLESLGSFELSGASLDAYGKPMTASAGDIINFTIVGEGIRPASSSTTTETGTDRSPLATGLLIAGIGMLVLSAVLMWRSRATTGSTVAVSSGETMASASVEELMQEMAALDMLYEEGQIKEKTYRTRRDRLKQQVAELMKKDK